MRSGPAPASVGELLAVSARDHAAAPALVTGGRTWTYSELWEGATEVAGGLYRAGLRPGELVVIALDNGAEFFLSFFGALIAGGIAVPVFPRSSLARLRSLAVLAGAGVIVAAESPLRAGKSDGHSGAVLLTPRELTGAHSISRPDAADAEQPCYVQYTSGSTSEPRGVVLTHANLLANIAQTIEAMSITRDDIFVSWLPTHHDMGLTLMTLIPFSLGTRTVLLPTDLRGIATWLAAIGAHGATFTGGPDLAFRLCARAVRERGRFDLSSLRVAINASEPVRASTLRGFEGAFDLGRVMMTGYGLAEATLSVTCTPAGAPIDVDARGLVCLGGPLPGTTLAISAGEGFLGSRQVGEILVRGPSVCAGYHRNPRATDALFLSEGGNRYMKTGDLGYLDDEGRLFFVARQKELIKLGGRSLYPQELEAVVEATPGVRLSAAIGVDGGNVAGEQLVVFAEVRAPEYRSEAELRSVATGISRALHESLGVRPRSTVLLRPRRIPLTSNGKLQRGVLRDAYVNGLLAPGSDVVFPLHRRAALPGQ